MTSRTLVISNPPHERVDLQKAAPVLGLIPVEFNLKSHYPIPEIWVAEGDPEAGIHAAEALTEAGARVVLVSSDALAAIPEQLGVHKFAFGDAGLRVLLSDGPAEIPYDHPVTGVYCVPRASTGGPGGSSGSDTAAFLDLYLAGAGGLTRLCFSAERVDFAGLGADRVPSHAQNMARLVARIEEAFTALRLDRRLVNMQIRRRTGAGAPAAGECDRRGYSFASAGYDALLQAVAPDLMEVKQPDWSSRLVFLTLR